MNIKFTGNDFLQNFIKGGYKNDSRTDSYQEPSVLYLSAFVEKGKYCNDRKNNTEGLDDANMIAEEKYTRNNCDHQACNCGYGK